MKPVIGIMPAYDREKNCMMVRNTYLDCVKDAGGIPFVFPYGASREDLERLNEVVDGYLFTGGNDVNPALYHDRIHGAVDIDEVRDAMETYVYMMARRDDKAVLGICRGYQLINVLEGGSLYQDLPTEKKTRISHKMDEPYTRGWHHVLVSPNCPLSSITDAEILMVNSIHHQGVRRIGSHLKSMAISEDGLTEALYYPGKKFIWAVQWHPEWMKDDEVSKKIFSAFVAAAGERK